MTEIIQQKLAHAPRAPGVYLMKDDQGTILYVGKSKDLKSRIHAYFSGTDSRFMIPFLVARTRDIDFIVTETEKAALILENHLIKKHRPKYNVNFRDDKAYFHIRIDLGTPFPRFQMVRKPQKDGARTFGPYPSSAAARETLRFLQAIFPLRTCSDNELKNRTRPCVEYQIKRCCAPCVGLIERGAYRNLVMEAVSFLEGKEKTLLRQLNRDMARASETLRFEEAASLRDRIAAIRQTIEKQVVDSGVARDQDVWGLRYDAGRTEVCILHVRGGKLLGKRAFALETVPLEPEEKVSSLVTQYYDDKADVPAWILLPFLPEDRGLIEEWLSEKKGATVRLSLPRRGRLFELLKMAERNAAENLKSGLAAREGVAENLAVLRETFQLRKTPSTMACFDISHMGGSNPVASMVTFREGKPWKQGYRRFKIRAVKGVDDYAMMFEALKRRFARDGERPDPLPDLLVVDGGRGQLGVALSVMRDLGIADQDVVAMAEERHEYPPRGVRKKEDRFYLPGRKDPVYLTRSPRALAIMQHLRDEAHRFAVAYYRKVKKKSDFHSILDDIPGIGEKRKKALLGTFGDLEAVESACVEEISAVKGIGPKQGRIVYNFLHSK
ncbi:MAG: excinuclease ABC subunit UvrC [Syntrophales bacterium]|jgi:excinuclease ABC subunit C|nr:excinuclease ABC subunit UvrC [Syntrophales bacterium]